MGLACINVESKDAIQAAVVELEKAGCVQRQITDKDGKFGFTECVIRDYLRPANCRQKGGSRLNCCQETR